MVDIGVVRGSGQAQVGQALEQDRQGDLQFQPGQGGTDAEMQASAKADMGFWRAMRVETVGTVPDPGVAVGCGQQKRHLIAALECVAYVTVFDELSPRSLIAKVLPDVLVKGGDWALDEIHGREEVEAAGGRVLPLPFVEGKSTTNIVERVLQVYERADT